MLCSSNVHLFLGSNRSPRRRNVVCACVRASVTLFKITMKMCSSSILKSPGGYRQESKQASKQVSKKAAKHAGKQSNMQASRQAVGRHSVGAMPWRGLFLQGIEPLTKNLSDRELLK